MSSKKPRKTAKTAKTAKEETDNQDLLNVPPYSGNIESIRITKKGVTDEYKPYTPEELSASAKKALNYSLTMIMGHVADFHTLVLHILSKKYGHSIEEMIDCVMDHPDATTLTKHPILRDLWCNFTEDDIPKDLQRHTDGLYVNEPPAPYYFSEAAAAKEAAAKEAAVAKEATTATKTEKTASAKTAEKAAKPAAKKTAKVTATAAVKTAKEAKTKPKSKIEDIFASSSDEE